MICSKECCPKVLQIVIGNRSRLWISDAQNSFGLALCARDVQVICSSKALLVTYFWHNPSRAAIQLSHSLIGMKAWACSSCVFSGLLLDWVYPSQPKTWSAVHRAVCSLGLKHLGGAGSFQTSFPCIRAAFCKVA